MVRIGGGGSAAEGGSGPARVRTNRLRCGGLAGSMRNPWPWMATWWWYQHSVVRLDGEVPLGRRRGVRQGERAGAVWRSTGRQRVDPSGSCLRSGRDWIPPRRGGVSPRHDRRGSLPRGSEARCGDTFRRGLLNTPDPMRSTGPCRGQKRPNPPWTGGRASRRRHVWRGLISTVWRFRSSLICVSHSSSSTAHSSIGASLQNMVTTYQSGMTEMGLDDPGRRGFLGVPLSA